MYAARSGKYAYIELDKRFESRPLPSVMLTDLADELREGNNTSVGSVLREEIRRNLLAGEQTILYLGRRGAAKYILCKACGYVPECERCSRAMTYHSANRRLMCHICSHSESVTGDCPKCGGDLVAIGYGTQRAQQDIEALFPNTPILRLDSDTTLRKGSAKKILDEFAKKQASVLIGTQMVTKGLDFPGVTLVGVLNADAALHAPDFRANERAFSLITQVVGRGGRGEKPGRAILQSYSGEHPVLLAAARQDYLAFYEQEIELRRTRLLPPFCSLTRLCFFGLSQEEVRLSCARVRDWINQWQKRQKSELRVLGPAPASVLKQNLRYRYHLSLLSAEKEPLRELCASILSAFHKDKLNKNVRIYADPDALEE
jgi:primosomal protein N' (replication factor Y)